MKSEYRSKARWIAIGLALAGIVLILIAALQVANQWSELFHHLFLHVGVALLIAAVVGLFLEIAEIQEFFENRLVRILGSDGFVGLLSEKKSLDLSIAAAKGLGRLRTTNPSYAYEDFAVTMGNYVFDLIGQPYRQELFESIAVRWLDQATAESLHVPPQASCGRLAELVQASTYTVIAPKAGVKSTHDVCFEVSFDVAGGLDIRGNTEFELLVDREPVEVSVQDHFTEAEGTLSWKFNRQFEYTDSCLIEARLTTIEYMADYYSGSMAYLTKDATVHFSSSEPLDIQADISGISGVVHDPSTTKNSIAIRFPGWVLPNHGYFISWTRL